MNDFASFEKNIIRELSCRLCLCTDVAKLKPLSSELKRKIKKLFDIVIRTNDSLPKAICHECLQQVGALHLYAVKVEKTQKFLTFHYMKNTDKQGQNLPENKLHPIIASLSEHKTDNKKLKDEKEQILPNQNSPRPLEFQQGDAKLSKIQQKKKSPSDMKFLEAMPLEEFSITESVDRFLLNSTAAAKLPQSLMKDKNKHNSESNNFANDVLDPIVLIEGRPAKQGAELDKQISLFYKMECCICHELGFHFRSLMKHYKDRHGVPGYLSCCDKKFHYFYPKKIIEHMAYHLQPDIFMCPSCHQNFQTSQQLIEHKSNGGRSEGKIACPRCSERYPTYQELGWHIISHRSDKFQCDYCGKLLKHHHRKKNVNHMEDVILCSQCIRTLKNIEKQEKDIKEKLKARSKDMLSLQKYQKFRQAMGLSVEDNDSTE